MKSNRAFLTISGTLSAFLLPVQMASTFVIGLLVNLSFGLLLWPITFVWWCLLAPLLGMSWVGGLFSSGREVIGYLGIPFALLYDVYVKLMPAMGEMEKRLTRILHGETWPYTWEFWCFQSCRPVRNEAEFIEVLKRAIGPDPARRQVVVAIATRRKEREGAG